jgi:simple sugar transport system permease protein
MSANSYSRWRVARSEILRALSALVIALVVAFAIVALTSKQPIDAFSQLLLAPLQRTRTVGEWIDEVAKLTMTGLAFSLVFQARQFSMGVPGQIIMGGIAATLVAQSALGNTLAAIPLSLIAGMVAGGIYGFIPGYAKARLGANEIVSSLMLNYIATDILNYLVRAVLGPPGLLMTDPFPRTAVFPAFIRGTRIDLGIVIAVVCVLVVWFALYRTRWGLKLRLVGHNPRFAEYAGIKATAIMVSAMTAAGAIGGLLGVMFVEGQAFGKLVIDFEGGLGFEGILIAIVARSRPLAVPIVAIFYGYLIEGANLMGIRTDVPAEVIGVVQAIIILLVASSFSLPGRKLLSRLRGRPSEAMAPASAEAEGHRQ